MAGALAAASALGGRRVNLPDLSDTDTVSFPSTATASFQINRAGTTLTGGVAAADWVVPADPAVGDSYWVRVTNLVGDPMTSGTVGSWLQLSSNRLWTLARGAIGSVANSFDVQISTDSGGSVIIDTQAMTLAAEVL